MQQVTVSVQEVKAIAKTDLDFLAAVAAPEIFSKGFPSEYKAIWKMICDAALDTDEKFQHFVLGLPRGFAKTTVIKLWGLWLIAYTNKRFILAVGSSSGKAESIIADIAYLLESDNVKAIFGSWTSDISKNTATKKVFVFQNKTVILGAIGAGGDPRGLNVAFTRPDVILMDDVQSRECAASKVQSEALRTWLFSTLYYTKSPESCIYVYIGNMYPGDDCIVEQLRKNPDWTSFIIGAILADGTSLWEDLHPIKSLLKGLRMAISNGTTHLFFAELLNDNSTVALTGFDQRRLKPWHPYYDINEPEAKFIVIDPSGKKKTSDPTAIGLFKVYEGVPWLVKLARAILTPKETIRQTLSFGLEHGCQFVFVEDIAYQDSLLFWFDDICRTEGIRGFTFLPINRGNKSKNVAIVAMLKQLQGTQLLGYTEKAEPELGVHPSLITDVVFDALKFNPTTTNNSDDLLDILAYASTVYLQHRVLLANSSYLTGATKKIRTYTEAETSSI